MKKAAREGEDGGEVSALKGPGVANCFYIHGSVTVGSTGALEGTQKPLGLERLSFQHVEFIDRGHLPGPTV
jgi:hypothetical protein